METLSKNKLKFYASLKQKKFRDESKLFAVEGSKAISDFLESGLVPKTLIVENEQNKLFSDLKTELFYADKASISKLTNFSEPPDAIAYFSYFESKFDANSLHEQLTIFCDGIQNPGNFGTIIRTAEWFGIKTILCSRDTADFYNPKVVQATMGSLARVNIFYVDFSEVADVAKAENLPIFGTFMDGKDILNLVLPKIGIVVLGNEGQGIRPQTAKFVNERLSIPRFSFGNKPESLNVSVAAALVLAEFRRQNIF